jgi:hypothetical protein
MLFDKDFNQVDQKPLDDGEGTGPNPAIEECRIVWRFDSNVQACDPVLRGALRQRPRRHEGAHERQVPGHLQERVQGRPRRRRGPLHLRKTVPRRRPRTRLDAQRQSPHGLRRAKGQRPPQVRAVSIRKKIVMWEKNGLRHGEFDLHNSQDGQVDDTTTTVLNIKWNSNSKAVAIEVAQG